jgi:osmoprotectant transport system permease protein
MSARGRFAAPLVGVALLVGAAPANAHPVTVGSKAFPESWILGEALTRLAQRAGATDAVHRANLGGTEIVDQGLRAGAIDAYPEYTGTIAEVIEKRTDRPSLDVLRAGVAPLGLAIGGPLGFNDGYGIAITRATARRLGLVNISDLARHPELKLGLTHEFLGRTDGWPGLAARYGLAPRDVRGLQHELAWDALAHGAIDATDVYTTDAQIVALDLVVLDDDRGYFPRYDAVVIYRSDLAARAPAVLAAWRGLEGRIDARAMTRANALVALGKRPYAEAADSLLAWVEPASAGGGETAHAPSAAATLLARLGEHVWLVFISLLFAVLLGLPLGIVATRSQLLARLALGAASLVQTVPSLALLAFLIPLVGIGTGPALIALFVYSLLPIVRNTYVGLTSLPRPLVEAAEAMGLSPRARLFRVALPLASPTILAGIQTSAVITVGTATIAALIGAGGLGEPILSGIQLRDPARIASGAVPAALLALLVSWAFDALGNVVVPRGLRAPRVR